MTLRKEMIQISNPNPKLQHTNVSQGSIYSICFQNDPHYSTPTVQSAHEQDMLSIRDDLFQNKASIETIFDTNLLTSSIKPAKQICMDRKIPELMRELRLQPLTKSQNDEPNVQSSTSKKPSLPPRKVTTAASFFGNHKASKNNEKGKKSNKTTGTLLSKQNLNKNASQTKVEKMRDVSDDDDKELSDDDTISKDKSVAINDNIEGKEMKPQIKSEERRSKRILEQDATTKKKSQKQLVHGNADDFIGDEDEDEDDIKDDIERRKRLALEERKEIRKKAIHTKQSKPRNSKQQLKNKMSLSEDEHEYDDLNIIDEKKSSSKSNIIFGSMDDFAQKVERNSMDTTNMKRKRQRKKMIEKTCVDSKGYMHTETVTVWETIPSEEENDDDTAKSIDSRNTERKKQKTQSSLGGKKSNMSKGFKSDSRKNTKNMKQTGLMGFFAKK